MTTPRKASLVSIGVILAFFTLFGLYTHAGYVSVVESGDCLRILDRGLHLKLPWQRVTNYPLRSREVQIEILDRGPDIEIHFDGVLFLNVCRDSIPSLHRAYRGAYVEQVVSPMLAKFLRERGEGYGLWDRDAGPQKVTGAVLGFLSREAGKYGINVHRVWLTSFDVEKKPDSMESL